VYFRGMKHLAAPQVGVLSYLEPVVAAAVGVLAFGEPFGWTRAGCIALILAAGAFVAAGPAPGAPEEAEKTAVRDA
jgi:drug/metabolite transporter (DMT)-like permease